MLKLLLCLCFFFCSQIDQPQVSTKYGSLRGRWMKSRSGKDFIGFQGIPYAKPPVGQLRFKDPEPPERWDDMRDATAPGQECIQYDHLIFSGNITGGEDCLFLSVYTPDILFSNLLPVLVYFHGGAFEYGGGQTGHGPEYLMDERIVVVTVSYRLGPFGFLSFEDQEMPGNIGLRDQVMALSWVRDNIAVFGGHPKKVTILGESAGGVSVSFHLVSPLSKGLFHRGISMSGTFWAPWAIVRPGVARQRAFRLAEDLDCQGNDTAEVLGCLRTRSATDIVRLRAKVTNELRDPLVYFGPVLDPKADKPFLPESPRRLGHSTVPWLIGVASGDGLLKTALFTNPQLSDWRTIDANLDNLIRTSLLLEEPVAGNDMLAEEIRRFYFNNTPLSEDSFANITDLYTDGWFWYPTAQAIRNHKGPIYLYYFDYLGESSFTDILGSRRVLNAACHSDEVIYLWNATDIFPPLRGDDIILSRTMVRLWTNFVKFGSPNTKDSILNWKKSKQNDYMHINNRGYSMETKLLDERTKFWTDLSTKYKI